MSNQPPYFGTTFSAAAGSGDMLTPNPSEYRLAPATKGRAISKRGSRLLPPQRSKQSQQGTLLLAINISAPRCTLQRPRAMRCRWFLEEVSKGPPAAAAVIACLGWWWCCWYCWQQQGPGKRGSRKSSCHHQIERRKGKKEDFKALFWDDRATANAD